MPDLKLKQVRSPIGANPAQRDTLRSLKLGRIGSESAMTDTPQLRGMLRVVEHLIVVDDGEAA